jgi:ethanolaminephosphotransferase
MSEGFFNFNFTPYIPPNSRENLLAYQYHGTDKSLIYKHMWKPLCARLVNYLPLWLAPNVITVTALLLTSMTHGVVWYYMPNLTVESGVDVPSWVFVASASALFFYQLLDNLDGHQARRTGTSSPLGLLMDHGCDAFNCVVGTLSVSSCVCAGPSWKSWTVLITTVIMFFMNTWEEYYRGALVLPIINGPNEGLMVAIATYLFTAWVGPGWWVANSVIISRESVAALGLSKDTVSHFLEMRLPARYAGRFVTATYTASGDVEILYNTVLLGFMATCAVITCAGNVLQVYRSVTLSTEGHGKYGSGWLLNRFPFVHALTRLLPLALVTIIANVWFFVSPDNIFRQHPRLFCWTVGLLYTKLCVHLMIAHLCSVEFHPFRRTLVPFVFFAVHIAITYFSTKELPIVDEEVLLYEFFALSATAFAHLTINASRDMATVLGIRVFSIAAKSKAQ